MSAHRPDDPGLDPGYTTLVLFTLATAVVRKANKAVVRKVKCEREDFTVLKSRLH